MKGNLIESQIKFRPNQPRSVSHCIGGRDKQTTWVMGQQPSVNNYKKQKQKVHNFLAKIHFWSYNFFLGLNLVL